MPSLLLLLLTCTSTLAEPPMRPSGMDLLYDEHIPLLPNGEPIVTVGIVSGETHLAVRSASRLAVSFYEAGVFKQATIPAGEMVDIRIKRAQPASRIHYVDLGGISPGVPNALEDALSAWKARGITDLHPVEEGTLLGIGGLILDNRDIRLTLPSSSRAAAVRTAAILSRRLGVHAVAKERLAERPWAELTLSVAQAPLGLATSYVRFAPAGDAAASGSIEVAEVEYARGYQWHGRANRRYRGELYAVVDPNGLLAAVNAIGAETLLQGVVPSEIFPSSPADALQAQAVAARNILFAKLGRRHHTDPYHLCGEQHCQVYGGVDKEDPRTNAAVAATVGQVLFHGEHLVDAVYSASCGGYTEDNDAVWGDSPNPALRGRPDFDTSTPELTPFNNGITAANIDAFVGLSPRTFCARATPARPEKIRWRRTLSDRDLEALLSKAYPRLGKLRDIHIGGRGRGGRVTDLRLQGSRSAVTVSRELPIRQLFGNLSSAAFALDVNHDAMGNVRDVTFVGGGWGHGVGLCQMGAIGRAASGQSYQEILSYYYNGAEVRQLYDRQ